MTGPKTRQDFEKIWQYDVNRAEHFLLTQGSVTAMFIVHPRNAPMIPVVTMFDSPETQAMQFDLIRNLCIASDAVGLGFMTETWMVRTPSPEDVPASRSPRREEYLLVAMLGNLRAEGERLVLTSLRAITRDAGGNPGLREADPDLNTGEGLVEELVGLLPAATPPGEERRRARAAAERMLKRLRRGKPHPH